MNFFRLSLKNIQGSTFRSSVVFLCALIVAALSLSILLVGRGAEDSLRLAFERMGADIVVVPQGAESKVETALLMGEPAQVWMPADNLKRVAAIPGVAAASPQIYLSTMEDAPCCAVSEMFVVVYDPATDFTVEPWLKRELGRDLGLGEAIGGRYVFVPPGEQKIEMYGYYVDLLGNMEPTGTNLDQTMFLNMDTAREMARVSKTAAMEELIIPVNSISTALVRVAPTASPDYVAINIAKQVPGVTPLVGLDLFSSYRGQMSMLQQAMVLILIVTSVMSLALLSLVFSMAANERHRQIGVLRALGATRAYVLQSLLSEAASLAFAGGAIGVTLGAVVVALYGHFIVSSLRLPFLMPAPATMALYGLGGLGAALLCVTLAAFLPAFRISRQSRFGDEGVSRPMTEQTHQAVAPLQGQRQGSAMIELRGVSKAYRAGKGAAVEAVREASLDVQRGEFIVITGRSGCGKTTLLHLIAGLTSPTSGKVLIDGRDVWSMPDEEQSLFRSQKIGFIFQFPSLLPALTVLENVQLPATFAGNGRAAAGKQRALELLSLVGLSDKLNAYSRQLSAGQQQRVVIARSLINQPELLLADEPTSNLDEQTEREIMSLLNDVRAATGVTVLLVSHASELVNYGTRSITMAAGQVAPA